jgi:predicted component of type VI protein secretion system
VELTGPLQIGRGADARLVLGDHLVSRAHARVTPSGAGAVVEDLDSLNGTWVNGALERAARLAPGDELRVGRITLAVEAGRPRPPPPRRRPRARRTAPGHPSQPGPAAPAAPPMPRLGAFAPPPRPRRRLVASRRLTPTLLSFGAVIVTAVALLVYFPGR